MKSYVSLDIHVETVKVLQSYLSLDLHVETVKQLQKVMHPLTYM